MSKRIIQVPATWDRASRKKDRTVSFGATSNLEVSNEDFALMDTFHGQSGYLIFSENELKEEELPTEDAPSKEGKSKGHRLRVVYFLIWKKRQVDEPFEAWYDRQFERLMDKRKEELQ
jgi:hypothetical protein